MSELNAESVFRDVNEHIREVSSRWADTGEPLAFLCECEDGACTEAVPLAIQEYDALRAARSHVLVPGHLAPFAFAA